MQNTLEQRYAIKFCVGLEKTGSETVAMVQQAFKDESMSQRTIHKWHTLFTNGRESVDDVPRAGRPSTSRTEENVQRVRDTLKCNSELSMRSIASRLSMDKMTVHHIIKEDLAKRKVSAKRVWADDRSLNRSQVSLAKTSERVRSRTSLNTPAISTASTAVRNTARTPARTTASTPARKTASTPARKTASTPARTTASTPTRKTANTPGRKTMSTPAMKTARKTASKAAKKTAIRGRAARKSVPTRKK